MFLVVALGNPGAEYQRNRHNVGFMVGEELRLRNGWPAFRARFQGLFGDGQMMGERVGVLLPLTFMNRSGQAAAEAARYHRVPVEHVLAVHDDVELPFGEVRLKEGGGLGGHNGLRSMEERLGTRGYWRARVGVGRPSSSRIALADFVLSDFSEPREEVLLLIGAAADAVEAWVRAGGSDAAQSPAPGGSARVCAAPNAAPGDTRRAVAETGSAADAAPVVDAAPNAD